MATKRNTKKKAARKPVRKAAKKAARRPIRKPAKKNTKAPARTAVRKAAPKKAFAKKAKRVRAVPKKPTKKPAKKAAPKKSAPKKTTPKKAAPKKMPAAQRKPVPTAIPPSEIATAALGFEEIVAQVSEGQAEEAGIAGSKFDIGVPHNAHAMPSRDIPHEYGKDCVMLLVVDPRFAFTYWEVRHDTMMEAQNRFSHQGKLTLRFYDITHEHNPDRAPWWDVEVFDRLGNWYLKLERPEQKICLDIGLKSPTGEFRRFARSNVMRLPPQSLAAPGPIKWMVVTPAGETLVSDSDDYTEAVMALLKKILGPYFFDLLMRGRFASIAGSSLEAIFYDVEALRVGPPPGESPSSPLAWARGSR